MKVLVEAFMKFLVEASTYSHEKSQKCTRLRKRDCNPKKDEDFLSPSPAFVLYHTWYTKYKVVYSSSPHRPRFPCFRKSVTCPKYNGNCWALATVGWFCVSARKRPVVDERSSGLGIVSAVPHMGARPYAQLNYRCLARARCTAPWTNSGKTYRKKCQATGPGQNGLQQRISSPQVTAATNDRRIEHRPLCGV